MSSIFELLRGHHKAFHLYCYIRSIADQESASSEVLSQATGIPREEVLTEIQTLVEKGLAFYSRPDRSYKLIEF
jgi:biotin operon repressor